MVRKDQVDEVKEILKDWRIRHMIRFEDEPAADNE